MFYFLMMSTFSPVKQSDIDAVLQLYFGELGYVLIICIFVDIMSTFNHVNRSETPGTTITVLQLALPVYKD